MEDGPLSGESMTNPTNIDTLAGTTSTPNGFGPIRLAEARDLAPLSILKLTCFRETFGPTGFNITYPPADLIRFEEEAYGHAKIADELADPEHRTWVVEDADGRLVAYAHAGPCKLPHPWVEDDDLELCQLYLLRDVQGMGLGKQLLDHVLGLMENAGPGALWLGVWQGNLKAQHVYAGRGFKVVGDYRFSVGNWHDEEFIMRRGLMPRVIDSIAG
jgi:ribosomal protein S18 acetylase RimI-like enzyme